MPIHKISLVLIVILGFVNLKGQNSKYIYKSLDETFSIRFPNYEVQYKQKDLITSLGILQNEVFYCEPKDISDPNHLYLLSRVKYPHNTFRVDSTDLIEEFLEEASQSYISSPHHKELYHSVSADERPPNLVMRLLDSKSNSTIKVKLLIIDQWLYALQVYTKHNNILNDQIDEFINSFKYY